MHLAETAWPDAADVDADVALLPVGSTEQHGPHAPLGTDAIAAAAVADAAADAYDGDVVVAPTVPVGVSEEHAQFDGTLWVSPDAFRAYVRDVVESLAAHGWRRVVAVNGHGGNVPALGEVAADVTRRGDAYAVAFTWFDAVDAPDMGHAGPAETSVLLDVRPDLVETTRFDDAAAGAADRWGEWAGGTNLAHDTAEFSENGVVGDPRDADAGDGEALLAAARDALVDVIAAVTERPLDRPGHR